MKSKNLIIVILLSLLVSVCVFHEKGIAESVKKIVPAKIAVIDIEKLILEGKNNEQFESRQISRKEKATAELENLRKEMLALNKSLATLKPTSKDYDKYVRALREKDFLYEARGKFLQQDLDHQILKWREFSFRSIMREAEKIAKAKGYDIILSKQAQRWPSRSHEELMMIIQTTKVIYHSEELDITDEVLEAWNAVKVNP
ncbi:MAG: OmpH family outer membrane protein [Planctomycetes bacterium]|nr:OmpH family outer membrane protein [Planctomycetota bacterium]